MPIYLITLVKIKIFLVKSNWMMLNTNILVFSPRAALPFSLRKFLYIDPNRYAGLATGTSGMINGKTAPAKPLIQQRSVTVCRNLTGLERDIVPSIIISIRTRTVVCLIKLYLASAHFQSSVMRKKAQRTQIRTILWQSLSWQLHLLLHQRRMPPRLTQRLHQPYLQ